MVRMGANGRPSTEVISAAVPLTAVLTGPQWTVTDNATASSTCAVPLPPQVTNWADLALQAGVVGSSPIISTTSTNALLAGVPTAPHSANRSTLPVATHSTTP